MALRFIPLVCVLTIIAAANCASAEDANSLIAPLELESPGRLSAAVYDAEGKLVRELLNAAPRHAGKQALIWDGLDRNGERLPAGDYTWKTLQTMGLRAKYLMSVGSSFPPGKEWNTACGPGTHAAPFGVAVDETGIYVAAHTTENIETCMLKMAPDGASRLWSTLHPEAWDGALSLAADGGEVYMLGHVMNNDGRVEPELKRKQRVYIFDAATGKLAPRTMSNSAVGPIPIKLDVQWDPAVNDMDANDMDLYEGVLVVAYEKRNALRWYDPKSGDLLATAEVAGPQGITVGAKGTVYVTTENRVVSLSREQPKPVEVVRGLDKPGRIDIDHNSGDLLVYLQDAQQIHRYSQDGKLKNTYGRKSGRQDGIYDTETSRSFAGFSDLCADGAGGFYVTESTTAPRRTAHFAADGSVIREWYGGQRWAPHAAPEGDNPNVLWVGSHYGWIMRVLVDYERKTWKVHSCYKYVGLGDGLVGDSHNEGCYFRVYRHAGSTYIALERLPMILKVDETAWKLLPVTVYGGVANSTPGVKEWGANHQSYQWNDGNGDGLPQQSEFTFYDSSMPSSYEPYIAPDFTCYTVSHDREGRRVHKFAVTRWNDAGAPLYGDIPTGTVHAECPSRFDPNHFADSRWSAFLHQDAKSGRLYAAFNDWTRDWCDYDDSFMHQWSPAGASQWTVSQRRAGTGRVLPGEVQTHLRGVAGVARDCVVAIDVNGGWFGGNTANTYVWDQDGLFVGGLMDATDLNGIEKHWYQCGGEFCHSAVHALPSGDVLFFGNWENEIRVYQIAGWDDWQRASGIFRLDHPRAAHTGQGLMATYFDDAALTKWRGVQLDTEIDLKWDAEQPAGVRWTGTIQPEYGPVYTGPWKVAADKACFDRSVRGSRDNLAKVSFRFRGTSISVVGKTGPNFGFADVALDGEQSIRFDCYSAEHAIGVSLFSKAGLSEGDHEVTLTVAGWYDQPRNPKSTDAWVMVDHFVVDGQQYDDAGIPYTFSADADGRLQLWVDRQPVLAGETTQASRIELSSKPVKLLREPTAIQCEYTQGTTGGGVAFSWFSQMTAKQILPTKSLSPVIPGGHVIEDAQQ